MINKQAKAELAAEMENLSREMAAFEKKFRELHAAGNDAYHDLKKGLDKAMGRFQD